MLRRLHHSQPDDFAFTAANQAWAEAQVTKYPQGRQASAIIALLWRAQEQTGWLTRPAMEHIADMLGLAHIRAYEVASFYFMFQLKPVGSVANIQICGTTSCMICGAEDLIGICREKIAANPHELSADGRFSWEEVECLGACTNAPMAQIGKDYYEDLTAARFSEILDELAAGKVPVPGPQNGRYAAEPLGGLTSLTEYDSGKTQYNASVQAAVDLGDTIKRIDGTEVPLLTPWLGKAGKRPVASSGAAKPKAKAKAKAKAVVKPKVKPVAKDGKPEMLTSARAGGADDLKQIKGVGPKMEAMLNKMGFYHFDQVAGWRAKEVQWVDDNLEGFKGRVSRDEWVKQAKVLAKGGITEFSKKVKKGGVYE
ncbi:MAG: NADH-quinone oxidoreductase subunit NuoE [Marinosulfonomonas sp.]|nr:MAG: NADH-quinone oxidoreductase subunit NuoE [Marinosulfonomonas sp.]